MKKRGERQHHQIEVTFGRRRRMGELSRVAKIRLYSWGSVIRAVIIAQGPAANPYNEQPFTKQRVDLETVHAVGQLANKFDEAEEVDGWLFPLRDRSPNAYRATVIRYIEREHGGHQLSMAEQVRRYSYATGQSKRTYYNNLDRVLQHVCAEILLKENPELKYE